MYIASLYEIANYKKGSCLLPTAPFHLPHFTVAFGIMKLNLLFLLLLRCKYTESPYKDQKEHTK